jgi:hypothetical protein
VAHSESPADVFKALLEASRLVVPRACVFLVRRGDVQGWGSVGYPTDVAASQRAHRSSLDQGWFGRAAQENGGAPSVRTAADDAPDFGQRPAAEAVACILRIDGKPIAAVLAEREDGEEPWITEGLALIVGVAELRLQLNLVRRKSARETAAADAGRTTAETTETRAPEPAVAESPEQNDRPELEVARRYARLVATDIRLYNEEAVMLGRRNGDLEERLGEHLGRGKETFERRHGELGVTGLELLREAYVQILAGGDGSLIPTNVGE